MQVLTIHYERLVNLGNYENEKYAVDVAVGEGDDPHEVARFAKHFVEQTLGLAPADSPYTDWTEPDHMPDPIPYVPDLDSSTEGGSPF